MGFDFKAEKQKAEAVAAEDKWDKARLWYEKVVFCIRSIEEIDNPFAKKESDPPTVLQLTLGFIWQGRKNSVQTTYKASPDMRLLVVNHPTPWHNMTLLRYQTKQGSYGYELDQRSTDDSACPWESASVQTRIPGAAMQLGGDTVEGSIEDISDALQSLGFEPVPESGPVTDETWNNLTKGSLMCKSLGLVIIPPERETLTEYAAVQLLVSMRQQWANHSISQAKSQL